MCEWGNTVPVWVKIPTDLSATGKERWKNDPIDSCIAPMVRALQDGGIDMRGSCCGHGCGWGHIGLQDGRNILITDGRYMERPVRGVAGLLRMLIVKEIWWRWGLARSAVRRFVYTEETSNV